MKIKWLSEEEIKKAKIELKDEDEASLESKIDNLKNQTLFLLVQLKNIVEWTDIEQSADYVEIIKLLRKVKDNQTEIDLDKHQLKVLKEIFEKALKSGKINGLFLEVFLEVYDNIKS